MQRRSFLTTPLAALAAAPSASARTADERISITGDGIPLSPADYARLYQEITTATKVEADEFARGGAVQALEEQFATHLGKESAVWLPTGTLANHLAVRMLAQKGKRVAVQAESHLYRDTGDCTETLSGLHLLPLGRDRASFTLDDVEREYNEASLGRVALTLGAVQIESPVRRKYGERFNFDEMKKISRWARERGIGLHLDGARIFLESAYTGRSVRDYAALFDTVYVSQYKYFNAPSGAILAGPKALLENLYQTRRMFGGSPYQAWPNAVIAGRFLQGFEQRFAAAVKASEQVIQVLSRDGNFELERIPNGTNIFKLKVRGVNPPVYQLRLAEAQIISRPPVGGEWFDVHVNETWLRAQPDEIVARLRRALG